MARALNQTMAWIISGAVSAVIFGSIVGIMLSNKGSKHEVKDEHDVAHGEDTSSHGSSHSTHDTHNAQQAEHAESHEPSKEKAHDKPHGSDPAHPKEAKQVSHDEEEIKAETFEHKGGDHSPAPH